MRRRRGNYAGQEWAGRDLWWVAAFFALLLLSVREIVFLYAAVAYLAAIATYFLIRYLERRRAEDANTAPYWTEQIKDD